MQASSDQLRYWINGNDAAIFFAVSVVGSNTTTVFIVAVDGTDTATVFIVPVDGADTETVFVVAVDICMAIVRAVRLSNCMPATVFFFSLSRILSIQRESIVIGSIVL
ncbi:hypothetical protein AVEN_70867-1 [Araneus ventricosus]|uniref:Uncharacterized protein n=1 Tax=Araneus ventricosus TaxID=182803 RepID=A0A4Y2HRG3_ARAVE|nr:hypothetical protein AVEN_70867-1 [Araneus ventricosus]